MVGFSKPPTEVENLAVTGQWEGDMHLGRSEYSRLGMMVEGSSRFIQLVALPENRKTATVRDAVVLKITVLGGQLARSLTRDRSKERAEVPVHRRRKVKVCLCDPHSPWQRRTAEPTEWILCQNLPRKLDFFALNQNMLALIATKPSERPKETLDWKIPTE